MEWILNEPPIPWLWIAGIAGVVALIIATPSLLQMIWCSPKIECDFGRQSEGGGQLMMLLVYNRPITSKLLRLFKVRRMTAESIVVEFSIKERSTGNCIESIVPCIYLQDGIKDARRISLPASRFPALAGMLLVNNESGKVGVFDGEKYLSPGAYYIDIYITVEGKEIHIRKDIVITNEKPFLHYKG